MEAMFRAMSMPASGSSLSGDAAAFVTKDEMKGYFNTQETMGESFASMLTIYSTLAIDHRKLREEFDAEVAWNRSQVKVFVYNWSGTKAIWDTMRPGVLVPMGDEDDLDRYSFLEMHHEAGGAAGWVETVSSSDDDDAMSKMDD
ncbi:uncharacterized protein LOC132031336 [Lycium ferocissimum]|uniref:uncharacterized protein LOC132031336 n=1 Tax=Lycium ferocissimum TaxID=112874 RepID=UPI00281691D0|nr:uncharacterized protein LOC132031336 [Lycium ferocissimum]